MKKPIKIRDSYLQNHEDRCYKFKTKGIDHYYLSKKKYALTSASSDFFGFVFNDEYEDISSDEIGLPDEYGTNKRHIWFNNETHFDAKKNEE